MIEKREIKDTQIYRDLSDQDSEFWFDYKKTKFLHNIDTFYYSVKLDHDFTQKSEDPSVLSFRKFFESRKKDMNYDDRKEIFIPLIGKNLSLLTYGFGKYYDICLECPEYFHIFMASKVPPGSAGKESVTSEVIVQIRSYMLWMYGVHSCFETSLEFVRGLLSMFGLRISSVQENRVDYCWHSNYLANPEKFFTIENFYRMRVDRYRGANFHTAKVGSEDYEVDYISLGKRGDKCFVRIYLKSKEVVEQGYKAFFLKLWFFHGLISRYDLYCYEMCYVRRNWQFMTIARLHFYLEHGSSDVLKQRCRQLIVQYEESHDVTDVMIRFADQITPKIHLVINVEYQTMRKGTKSYQLLPVRDNEKYGAARRVYDYLDNRPLISQYLTHDILRLVEPNGDSNKSRRDYCGFWKALRSTKMIDCKRLPEELSLIRIYNRKLNKDVMKRLFMNKAIVYGIYTKGINSDDVLQDCMDALLKMNDNDLRDALMYKHKKIREFNGSEFTDTVEDASTYDFVLVDQMSGAIYNDSSTLSSVLQEWSGYYDSEAII